MFSSPEDFRKMAVRILQSSCDSIAFELKRSGRWPKRVEVLYDMDNNEFIIDDKRDDAPCSAAPIKYGVDQHPEALMKAISIMLERGSEQDLP